MPQQTPQPDHHPIVPRRMDFQFDPATIPRWWLAGNPILTHYSNGLHMLFPEGERFFIRSVKYYLNRIDDPELQARARNFYLQEAQHGKQHALSFAVLEQQGYDVAAFLDQYEKEYMPWVEKWVPPLLKLSITVALEHLTAALGENALTDPFLDLAEPRMQALLRWHAAEEIEHKAVAFDVLQYVHKGYFVRALGMVLALSGILIRSGKAARSLLAQEKLSKAELAPFREEAKSRRQHFKGLLKRAIRDYLRPGFHPDQHDNYQLARDYLASVGRLAA